MNIITKLNIRQKIMLALTLLAAIFLIWQIYNFVHNEAAPQSQAPASSPNAAVVKPSADTALTASPPKVIRELPSEEANPALINEQRQYLEMVRQYQITKMKRQILEEQAAVASAQKRISEAGLARDYSGLNAFVGPTVVSSGYQLSYVDRQAGQWLATINENGQYHEVHVGSRLADGSRVVAINNDKVVLRRQQGKNWELKFPGNANVNESTSINNFDNTIQGKRKPTQPNAKIAKILGITTAPGQAQAPVALVPPVAKVPAQTPVVLPPPVTSVPQPQPNKPATTDIPAAPLTVAPEATPAPDAAASVPASEPATAVEPSVTTPSSAAAPVSEVPAAQSSPDNSTIAGKPVSVKELRDHQAAQSDALTPIAVESEESNQKAAELNQISWQQAADLQAAVMNDK